MNSLRMTAGGAIALTAALLAAACGARAEQPPKPAAQTVVWRQLGSWSGYGNRQTESFTSDTGTLRVRWEATPETSTARAGSPNRFRQGYGGPPKRAAKAEGLRDNSGVFRVTAHSAISGRPLQQAVDQTGAGSGVGYVQQDPHVFYIVVESSRLNWKFTVEEAIVYP